MRGPWKRARESSWIWVASASNSEEAAAVQSLVSIGLEDIVAAGRRIQGLVTRTPLVRLHVEQGGPEIYLKLENLQPIGSFKLRGAGNALLRADPSRIASGVWTPSAGNMAQGVAWTARQLGIPCRVVVPEGAPRTKLEAAARLGARIVPVPFDTWWQALSTGVYPEAAEEPGVLVHSVVDAGVMAGNGTIGLEIFEDLPDVNAVLVPYGGGGLVCGIATALRALRPGTRIFACEVEPAAPLAASLAAGEPRSIDARRSFVDGISSKSVLPEMWPLVRQLVEASLVVSLEETAAAVRLLVERARIVAEGAGAVPVAAALAGRAGGGKLVCVVSGGNIDTATLCTILAGGMP
jgi:threonine dehydratase